MATAVQKMGTKGQVTLPKRMREALGLKAGDLLETVLTPEGALTRRVELKTKKADDPAMSIPSLGYKSRWSAPIAAASLTALVIIIVFLFWRAVGHTKPLTSECEAPPGPIGPVKFRIQAIVLYYKILSPQLLKTTPYTEHSDVSLYTVMNSLYYFDETRKYRVDPNQTVYAVGLRLLSLLPEQAKQAQGENPRLLAEEYMKVLPTGILDALSQSDPGGGLVGEQIGATMTNVGDTCYGALTLISDVGGRPRIRTPEDMAKDRGLKPPGTGPQVIPFNPTMPMDEYLKLKAKANASSGVSRTGGNPE